MSSRTKFKTLVILDLETTGLIYDEPKITELAMIAVHVCVGEARFLTVHHNDGLYSSDTLEQMKSNEPLPRVMVSGTLPIALDFPQRFGLEQVREIVRSSETPSFGSGGIDR